MKTDIEGQVIKKQLPVLTGKSITKYTQTIKLKHNTIIDCTYTYLQVGLLLSTFIKKHFLSQLVKHTNTHSSLTQDTGQYWYRKPSEYTVYTLILSFTFLFIHRPIKVSNLHINVTQQLSIFLSLAQTSLKGHASYFSCFTFIMYCTV